MAVLRHSDYDITRYRTTARLVAAVTQGDVSHLRWKTGGMTDSYRTDLLSFSYRIVSQLECHNTRTRRVLAFFLV